MLHCSNPRANHTKPHQTALAALVILTIASAYRWAVSLRNSATHQWHMIGPIPFGLGRRAADVTGDANGRYGSRLWENVCEPRKRRTVFSIGFFR